MVLISNFPGSLPSLTVAAMTTTPNIAQLQVQFDGTLHTPGSTDYDGVRKIWNGQIDRRPALVATSATTDDVSRAVRYANDSGLPLSVRAGGHHVGGSAIVEAGVVVDLAQMNGVMLDTTAAVVRVQGGAKLGDLDRGTLPHGFVTPAGIDHDTGVGGLTLGGGIGWSMRKHGLTCDNLRAVTMVNAAGEIVHASDESDPELMWGLRGGGGNFGIVTEFEFAAHPLGPSVLAGFVFYDGDDTVEVLRNYRSAVAEAPDELTTIVFLRIAPNAPWIPSEVVGKPVVMVGAVWLGDAADGTAAVDSLRRFATPVGDTISPKPMIEHQAVLEGANPVGNRYYWKSAPLADLSDEVINLLAEHLRTISSPHSLLGFFQLGGAIAEPHNGCLPQSGRSVSHQLRGAMDRRGGGRSSSGLDPSRYVSDRPTCARWRIRELPHRAGNRRGSECIRRGIIRPIGCPQGSTRPEQRLSPQPEHPAIDRCWLTAPPSHGQRQSGVSCATPSGALQVPFGEFSTFQYIPPRLTNPRKWDLLGRTDMWRDIL